MNLACRDPGLRSQILKDIHGIFKTVWSYKVPEEVNEILFCTDHHLVETADDGQQLHTDNKQLNGDNNKQLTKSHQKSKNHNKKEKKALIEAFEKVNKHTKGVQKSCNARNEEELLDLDEAFKQLKLENISTLV